ncbi:MAG: molybdenum cofactor guanylyltransferase [Coriobacteriia bacterium]
MSDPDGSSIGLPPSVSRPSTRLPISGVVLAGGRSRRMGEDKSLLEFDGEPLVFRVASTLSQVCSEVMVVASDSEALDGVMLPPAVRVLADEVAFQGPLGGLATALAAAEQEWVFACGVDMPFLCAEVVRLLWDELVAHSASVDGERVRLVMPIGDAGPEPLLSLFRRDCIDAVHEALAQGSRKVVDLCDRVEVLVVPVERLRAVDPQLRTLVNINTCEDLTHAREIAGQVLQ